MAALLLALPFGAGRAQSVSAADSLKATFAEWNIPVTAHNKVVVMKNGKAKFHQLFRSLNAAQEEVNLEYFNFRNDTIAGALFGLLAHKAEQGVQVHALFDAFGNMSNNRPLKARHLKELHGHGIEIYEFDPIRFPWVNHVLKRDHRKIVVIDRKVAYTGGMNVADYYLDGTPQVGDWRDMHMRIEGPAVEPLQTIFEKMWKKTTKKELPALEGTSTAPVVPDKAEETHDFAFIAEDAYLKDIVIGESNSAQLLRLMAERLDTITYGIGPQHEEVEMAIVDREPGKTPKHIRRAYVESINLAQQKIKLINPYFVPTHSIKRALKRAAKRGVDLQVMISSRSDIPFTPDASNYFAYQLVKRGAKVYLFDGGFHHSKIMMVDDDFCTLGSANLNSRSLRYDYEVNSFIFNQGITKELCEMFEEDKQQSHELTKTVWKGRTRWSRFRCWFANLLTPFL